MMDKDKKNKKKPKKILKKLKHHARVFGLGLVMCILIYDGFFNLPDGKNIEVPDLRVDSFSGVWDRDWYPDARPGCVVT